MDNFSKEFCDGEIEYLERLKAARLSREGSPQAMSAPASGCADARAAEQPSLSPRPIAPTKSDPAEAELLKRLEYCDPVFEALAAEIAAKHYGNALYHIEPLIRELKLCEHDCRYLVELKKKQAAGAHPAAGERAGRRNDKLTP